MPTSFLDFLQKRSDAPRTTAMRGPDRAAPLVIRAPTTKERLIEMGEDLADIQSSGPLGFLTSLALPARAWLDDISKRAEWERSIAGLTDSEISEGLRNGTLKPYVLSGEAPMPGKKPVSAAVHALEREAVRKGLDTGSLSKLMRAATRREELPQNLPTSTRQAPVGVPKTVEPSPPYQLREGTLVTSEKGKPGAVKLRGNVRVAEPFPEQELWNAPKRTSWIKPEELQKLIADPKRPVRSSTLNPKAEKVLQHNDAVMRAGDDPGFDEAVRATTAKLSPGRGSGFGSIEDMRNFMKNEEALPHLDPEVPGSSPLPNVLESSLDRYHNVRVNPWEATVSKWLKPETPLRHETATSLGRRREALRADYDVAQDAAKVKEFTYPDSQRAHEDILDAVTASKSAPRDLRTMRAQHAAINKELRGRLPQRTLDEIRTVMGGPPTSTPAQPSLSPESRTILEDTVKRLRGAYKSAKSDPKLGYQVENITRAGTAVKRKLNEGVRTAAPLTRDTIPMVPEPQIPVSPRELPYPEFLDDVLRARRLDAQPTGVELGTLRPGSTRMEHVDSSAAAVARAKALAEHGNPEFNVQRRLEAMKPSSDALAQDVAFYKSLAQTPVATTDADLLGLSFNDYMKRLQAQREPVLSFWDKYNRVMNNPEIPQAAKAEFNMRVDVQDGLRNLLDAFRRRGR